MDVVRRLVRFVQGLGDFVGGVAAIVAIVGAILATAAWLWARAAGLAVEWQIAFVFLIGLCASNVALMVLIFRRWPAPPSFPPGSAALMATAPAALALPAGPLPGFRFQPEMIRAKVTSIGLGTLWKDEQAIEDEQAIYFDVCCQNVSGWYGEITGLTGIAKINGKTCNVSPHLWSNDQPRNHVTLSTKEPQRVTLRQTVQDRTARAIRASLTGPTGCAAFDLSGVKWAGVLHVGQQTESLERCVVTTEQLVVRGPLDEVRAKSGPLERLPASFAGWSGLANYGLPPGHVLLPEFQVLVRKRTVHPAPNSLRVDLLLSLLNHGGRDLTVERAWLEVTPARSVGGDEIAPIPLLHNSVTLFNLKVPGASHEVPLTLECSLVLENDEFPHQFELPISLLLAEGQMTKVPIK